MPKAKIAVTLERRTLARIDRLVRQKAYPSRSRAVEEAVQEKLSRMDRNRLARECAKLNPEQEKALAEEGLATEVRDWPPY